MERNASAKKTVIKFGKTLCPVSVTLCDAHGTQIAVAQVTYMRLGDVTANVRLNRAL
jgi:hypothetical protein